MSLFPGRVLGAELAADLRDLHQPGLEHGVQLLPVAAHGSAPTSTRRRAASASRPGSVSGGWRCRSRCRVLVWNMMMSMSGGWFFVVASEAISVGDTTVDAAGHRLLRRARDRAARPRVRSAGRSWRMRVVILLYDQLLFRPLVAWAATRSASRQRRRQVADSWVLRLLRRTRCSARCWHAVRRGLRAACACAPWLGAARRAQSVGRRPGWSTLCWHRRCARGAVAGRAAYHPVRGERTRWAELGHAFVLGCITLIRVVVLIALATLVWVPVGVWIGLRPVLAERVQPIAQFLAAFPANLLFPVVVVTDRALPPRSGHLADPLMILGTQWYILFNVIAGAAAFPTDLREAAAAFGFRGWLWWRQVITARDLSVYRDRGDHRLRRRMECRIVAEAVIVGDRQLAAHGPWGYIAQATAAGDYAADRARRRGDVAVRHLFNRLLWRPLYAYAERVCGSTDMEHPAHGIVRRAAAASQVEACRQAYHKRPSGELRGARRRRPPLREGEIVGLLGRSGRGKSTLLRIVAGLVPATAGEVLWRGRAIDGPREGIAMVFQSFALFPWLTVLENVEAGLEAQRRPRAPSARARAGGDRPHRPRWLRERLSEAILRRHAPARRLRPRARRGSRPAADGRAVLGARRADRGDARSDLVDLWSERKLAIGDSAGDAQHRGGGAHVRPHSGDVARTRGASARRSRCRCRIRATASPLHSGRSSTTSTARMTAGPAPARRRKSLAPTVSLTTWLPIISASRIAGLTETLADSPFDGSAELSDLAARLRLDVGGLFRVAEVAEMLRLRRTPRGDIASDGSGARPCRGRSCERNRLFAEHLLRSVPLVAYIRRVLEDALATRRHAAVSLRNWKTT